MCREKSDYIEINLNVFPLQENQFKFEEDFEPWQADCGNCIFKEGVRSTFWPECFPAPSATVSPIVSPNKPSTVLSLCQCVLPGGPRVTPIVYTGCGSLTPRSQTGRTYSNGAEAGASAEVVLSARGPNRSFQGAGHILCLDLGMVVFIQSINTHWVHGSCQSQGCLVIRETGICPHEVAISYCEEWRICQEWLRESNAGVLTNPGFVLFFPHPAGCP